jgi:hypothetical protein
MQLKSIEFVNRIPLKIRGERHVYLENSDKLSLTIDWNRRIVIIKDNVLNSIFGIPFEQVLRFDPLSEDAFNQTTPEAFSLTVSTKSKLKK